ncbi:hypothetical protein AB0K09_21980 [Streptomyces sp. NPDC049577]|uniref:hypothetical protein n=1 Tax=Streptomyces sp. NPDC049577 TaxID=3155153 RepID=UPI0034367216
MTDAMTDATTDAGAGAPTGAPAVPAQGSDAPGTAPDAPEPLGVDRTPTGDAAVDASLARLADADHLGVSGHLEVYEDVHRGLRDALTALDRPAGPPAPTRPYDNRS